ncbi:BspA family leucine-rich repeat surface protein [Flavivirga eckloniae]|nr:BspA family leucine-rich repeat surface protein [Flavivirga eckloniae]
MKKITQKLCMLCFTLIASCYTLNAQFITTWKTTTANESIDIYAHKSEIYNYSVDWGDGNTTNNHTSSTTHSYALPGIYTVSITGDFPRINFSNKLQLQSVEQWGDQIWTTMEFSFFGCKNLKVNATDNPNLSKVTNMSHMFSKASSFNQDISDWDVSNVTNMDLMFFQATSFNQNIGEWNVSNVTDMRSMFVNATSFNQDISAWNVSKVTNMKSMFGGAASFNQNISDWDVSNVTDMDSMFYGATSFDQDISGWNVSKVTDMKAMFYGATSFDQNLSNWNVSKVTTMSYMFYDNTLSTKNYDALLQGWSKLTLQNGIKFHGGNSSFCSARDARAKIIKDFGWIITDSGEDCSQVPFITTWKTTSANESITIPTALGETYNYTVNWGDGETTTNHKGNTTHSYTTAGTYTVSITGDFPRIYFNNTGDRLKIQSIEQWGNQIWTSMHSAFYGCNNLKGHAIDTPNLSRVNNMGNMFRNATSFNQDISDWDVSNVTNMSSLFKNATNFNQDINSWNVSNVTSMNSMFNEASSFNQPIGSWDTSKVTSMSYMFYYNTVFNQDISDWDVSNVTNMSNIFDRASSFNQPIGNWNVSNVTNMEGVFRYATNFSQDISSWNVSKTTNMINLFAGALYFNHPISEWNVSKVTTMDGMFYTAKSFNQDISSWDVSNVTDMAEMFSGALAFDHPISKWNVSKVTNMSYMFYGARSFNQDISAWNVSNVTNMSNIFDRASSFNHPIGNWNVSKVTNMSWMFSGATSFNQNISAWNVSNVTDMDSIFQGATLSTKNYDALLKGWSSLALQNGVKFHGGNSSFCKASDDRAKIIADFNWTIIDNGENCRLNASFNRANHVDDKKSSNLLSIQGINSNEISVYPNPTTSNKLFVTSKQPIDHITIYSIHGALIGEVNNDVIDVSLLANGMYLLKIKTNTGTTTKRFIKK